MARSLGIVGTILVFLVRWSSECNEAICGSIVSKCMLTESCKCDLATCSCCRECFACLSYLFDECCSCFGLCPKEEVTDDLLSKKSHVEELIEPIPGLFRALTSEPDAHERWHTFVHPVQFNFTLFPSMIHNQVEYRTISGSEESGRDFNGNDLIVSNAISVNCTVVYIAECVSWNKCERVCRSVGAGSYRWFHDGCCQCVGDTCLNFGINESRCQRCSIDQVHEDSKDRYNQEDITEIDDDWPDYR